MVAISVSSIMIYAIVIEDQYQVLQLRHKLHVFAKKGFEQAVLS